jgi:hypothetical protein
MMMGRWFLDLRRLTYQAMREINECLLVRHAGLEEPAPYSIRGHPETLENPGFRLEFIPMEIGAGMTPLC